MKFVCKFIQGMGLILALFIQPGFASPPQYLITQAMQEKITPADALALLKEGNIRFVNNKMRHYNYAEISKYSATGQYPFGIVLNCIDSRSAPDFTFDQGLGNIFITRMAGNVVDIDVIGGMEFATKFAGAKIIAVIGHTYCGAVAGACNGVKSGNLTHLLSSIIPAVQAVKADMGKKFSCNDPKIIDRIAKENVINQMQYILRKSPTIRELVKNQKVLLVGGMHDLVTRKVHFFTIDGKDI